MYFPIFIVNKKNVARQRRLENKRRLAKLISLKLSEINWVTCRGRGTSTRTLSGSASVGRDLIETAVDFII